MKIKKVNEFFINDFKINPDDLIYSSVKKMHLFKICIFLKNVSYYFSKKIDNFVMDKVLEDRQKNLKVGVDVPYAYYFGKNHCYDFFIVYKPKSIFSFLFRNYDYAIRCNT